MAVASVLAQTLEDWELLVVVDDDEGGLEWLDALADDRIRILSAPAPGGT
jgi:glycosyltransferase involved in cell wall biosynthesis